MRSSYAKNRYDVLLAALTQLYQPKSLLEVGILDGFSLKAFADAAPDCCEILAFDLFDAFVGNHADEKKLREQFASYKNVRIEHGDFWKLQDRLEGMGFDFVHVDVANEGRVYDHAFEHYLPLVNEGGLLLLEGGGEGRDEVEWMKKYEKKPIQTSLAETNLKTFTFSPFPGLTIVEQR